MRIQVIAVEDLARVLYAAATRPDLSGRRGFAAAEAVTTRELVTEVASFRRRRPWMIGVPGWGVRLAGLVESARQWVTGRARPFNRDKAREVLQKAWLCDAGPFLADLGISDLMPWKQGIRAVCRCYLEAGWLRESVWSV